jgi:mannose-6-phosphate isomerase-like protein (cupin superfamily)
MITIVQKSEGRVLAEHPGSSFTEYGLPFQSVSVGVSEIRGRYPANGWDVDTQVEQVWYVESGQGNIENEQGVVAVHAGDMIYIPKGEKYRIEGTELKLVVSSSPPWTAEQHVHLGE